VMELLTLTLKSVMMVTTTAVMDVLPLATGSAETEEETLLLRSVMMDQ